MFVRVAALGAHCPSTITPILSPLLVPEWSAHGKQGGPPTAIFKLVQKTVWDTSGIGFGRKSEPLLLFILGQTGEGRETIQNYHTPGGVKSPLTHLTRLIK